MQEKGKKVNGGKKLSSIGISGTCGARGSGFSNLNTKNIKKKK